VVGGSLTIIHDKNQMLSPVRSKSFPFFMASSSFPEYLQKNTPQEKNDCLEQCDLSDWGFKLSSNRYNCYYSALYLENYNRIMTLLFIEEIDEDENQDWEEPHF
jgi:hypothetical protein